GRFLEMISEVLGVPLSDIGKVALESRNSIPFNTICAVFARSEALAYMRRGVEKGDILSGLNEAISVRCLSLLKRVSIQNDFAITGGIAKNKGMVAKLTEKVGLQPQLAEDPQLIGALGAALFALDKLRGKNIKERFKVNYGYSDGSGSYFIAVDPALCDGCGKCISACPASLYEVTGTDGLKNAAVKPAVRRKISTLCPGAKQCRGQEGGNCKQVCPQQAIELSW
ncbi:MAG TPA: BadF/BadG/BcrA/BcrD ATPase family protein, partial [Dehalococcoidales bacterium]|nr:BadF/BadG/BcrA/BcrD ATPase family protein [Dehalococcoidales bacterium]